MQTPTVATWEETPSWERVEAITGALASCLSDVDALSADLGTTPELAAAAAWQLHVFTRDLRSYADDLLEHARRIEDETWKRASEAGVTGDNPDMLRHYERIAEHFEAKADWHREAGLELAGREEQR
jgi:hypothetical protein